jgi:hypothetical protein
VRARALTQELVSAALGTWCLGTVGRRAGREKCQAAEVDLDMGTAEWGGGMKPRA